MIEHRFGGAHLTVIVRGREDRNAGSTSGAEDAVEDPAAGMDDVRAEASDEDSESPGEVWIRDRREEQVGLGGVCSRHARHCHWQAVYLDAVELLPTSGFRMARG